MRNTVLAIALMFPALASAQAPPAPAPVEPVARIVAPTSVNPGDLIILTNEGSIGDGFAWARVLSDSGFLPIEGGSKCVFATGTPGVETFILFSVRSNPPKVVSTRVSIQIKGEPPTPVNPDKPAPKPLPEPTSEFQRLGREYAKAQISTYAETWDESSAMLAAGTMTRADANSTFAARWQARRDTAFGPVAAAFARVAPDAVEPSGATKTNLLEAWKQFATGLREVIR